MTKLCMNGKQRLHAIDTMRANHDTWRERRLNTEQMTAELTKLLAFPLSVQSVGSLRRLLGMTWRPTYQKTPSQIENHRKSILIKPRIEALELNVAYLFNRLGEKMLYGPESEPGSNGTH